MPTTKEEMRLMFDVAEVILEVADMVTDMTRSDLQGMADMAAVRVIKMVQDAHLVEWCAICEKDQPHINRGCQACKD